MYQQGLFSEASVLQNVTGILSIYEEEFGKLSTRFFTEGPWPNAELVAPMVNGGECVGGSV